MKMSKNLAMLFLKEEIALARSRKAHLTYRAFAKAAGLSSGRLSEYVSGKRKITPRVASKISKAMGFSKEKTQRFIACCNKDSGRLVESSIGSKYHDTLSDPRYFEFLALLDLKNFQSDLDWIAKKMSLSVAEVEGIISFWRGLKIIHILPNGGIFKIQEPLISDREEITEYLKVAYMKRMERSRRALQSYVPDKMVFQSTTFAIDSKKIGQAFRLISEFRDRMLMLQGDSEADEVYGLDLQLYPIIPPLPPAPK